MSVGDRVEKLEEISHSLTPAEMFANVLKKGLYLSKAPFCANSISASTWIVADWNGNLVATAANREECIENAWTEFQKMKRF